MTKQSFVNVQFERFFSMDSAKAIKAQEYGYLNAINYMAPHKSAGVGNLCSHASPVCIELCLGLESGQASMVSAKTNWTNAVRESRGRKARYFMHQRKAFMGEMLLHIARAVRSSKAKDMKVCVRPNGASDIAYEGIRVEISEAFAAYLSEVSGLEVYPGLHTIFSAFPSVQFVDYTKNHTRFNRKLPANYHLTFSRSEINEAIALELLAKGVNVAVIFASGLPAVWHGFEVVDGDKHDLRHLDPKGARGFVIGLSPKGHKAKKDQNGFVLRNAA